MRDAWQALPRPSAIRLLRPDAPMPLSIKLDSLRLDYWFGEGSPPPALTMPEILKYAGLIGDLRAGQLVSVNDVRGLAHAGLSCRRGLACAGRRGVCSWPGSSCR